jgi:hypothetical protein
MIRETHTRARVSGVGRWLPNHKGRHARPLASARDRWAERTQMLEKVRDTLHRIQDAIPPGEALVRLDESSDSWILVMEPQRDGASDLELRVAKFASTCDVGAGRSAQWSDLACTPERVVEIVDAIRNGQFEETFWELGRLTLQSAARLTLKSETLHARRVNPLYLLGCLLVRQPNRRTVYAPYRESPRAC